MKHIQNRQWKFTHIALICVLPLFTACGGKEKSNCSLGDLITSFCLNVVIEQALTGGSSAGDASGSSGGSSGSSDTSGSSGGSTGSDDSVVSQPYGLNRFDEFEPNDIFENANPVQFPAVVGTIRITGSVQENEDPSDFFIVSPDRSGSFAIRLYYPCTESCSELVVVVDDAVYLTAYDQNQTSIVGTPIGTVTEQGFSIDMTPGLPYYFAVHGHNTGAQPFPYILALSE